MAMRDSCVRNFNPTPLASKQISEMHDSPFFYHQKLDQTHRPHHVWDISDVNLFFFFPLEGLWGAGNILMDYTLHLAQAEYVALPHFLLKERITSLP